MLIYDVRQDGNIQSAEVKDYDKFYYVTLDEHVWYRRDRVHTSYESAYNVAMAVLKKKSDNAKREYNFYQHKIEELMKKGKGHES